MSTATYPSKSAPRNSRVALALVLNATRESKGILDTSGAAGAKSNWEGVLPQSIDSQEILSLLEDGRFRLRLLRALEQQDIHSRSLSDVLPGRDESEW